MCRTHFISRQRRKNLGDSSERYRTGWSPRRRWISVETSGIVFFFQHLCPFAFPYARSARRCTKFSSRIKIHHACGTNGRLWLLQMRCFDIDWEYNYATIVNKVFLLGKHYFRNRFNWAVLADSHLEFLKMLECLVSSSRNHGNY